MKLAHFASTSLFAVALASCTSGPQLCYEALDCPNGKCVAPPMGGAGMCATDCTDDSDCADHEYCNTTRWATPGCEPTCAAGDSRWYELCVDGRWVACADAGAAFDCAVCGCGTSQFCGSDGQCQPLVAAGEPCTDAQQCVTSRCGVPQAGGASRCVVGTEEACTPESCAGLCIEGLCFPECASHDACRDDRYRCYARRDGERYFCRRYCEFTDCPAGQECVRTNDPEVLGGGYFCFPPG